MEVFTIISKFYYPLVYYYGVILPVSHYTSFQMKIFLHSFILFITLSCFSLGPGLPHAFLLIGSSFLNHIVTECAFLKKKIIHLFYSLSTHTFPSLLSSPIPSSQLLSLQSPNTLLLRFCSERG